MSTFINATLLHTNRTTHVDEIIAALKAENLKLKAEVKGEKDKLMAMLKKIDELEEQFSALTLRCSNLEKEKKSIQESCNEALEALGDAEMLWFAKGRITAMKESPEKRQAWNVTAKVDEFKLTFPRMPLDDDEAIANTAAEETPES